jgi:hypothetical protein
VSTSPGVAAGTACQAHGLMLADGATGDKGSHQVIQNVAERGMVYSNDRVSCNLLLRVAGKRVRSQVPGPNGRQMLSPTDVTEVE